MINVSCRGTTAKVVPFFDPFRIRNDYGKIRLKAMDDLPTGRTQT